jgi:hypothetical protein
MNRQSVGKVSRKGTTILKAGFLNCVVCGYYPVLWYALDITLTFQQTLLHQSNSFRLTITAEILTDS